MNEWPDRRIQDLFSIELPIIQAPMAGVSSPAMAAAAPTAFRTDRRDARSAAWVSGAGWTGGLWSGFMPERS